MAALITNANAERDALALFDAALEVPADTRAAWLAERRAGATALLARVRALLPQAKSLLQKGGS